MTPPREQSDIVLVPHDPSWAQAAAAESARWREVLGAVCSEVLHLGSTAIPGIAAKPVLDLFPVVVSLEAFETLRTEIEALGYEWRGEFGIAGRRYCVRVVDGKRRFNAHTFAQGSSQIARHRHFRDYLIAHPEETRAYEVVKVAAARAHQQDLSAYNDFKSEWIRACDERAAAWAGSAVVTLPRR